MAAAVLDQLGDDYKNHRVYIKSGADDGNCLTVTVYFSGEPVSTDVTSQ